MRIPSSHGELVQNAISTAWNTPGRGPQARGTTIGGVGGQCVEDVSLDVFYPYGGSVTARALHEWQAFGSVV